MWPRTPPEQRPQPQLPHPHPRNNITLLTNARIVGPVCGRNDAQQKNNVNGRLERRQGRAEGGDMGEWARRRGGGGGRVRPQSSGLLIFKSVLYWFAMEIFLLQDHSVYDWGVFGRAAVTV